MGTFRTLAVGLLFVGTGVGPSEGANATLYFVDHTGIYTSETDGSGVALFYPNPPQLGCTNSHLEVDVQRRELYLAWKCPGVWWAGIERHKLDGSGLEEIAFCGHCPSGGYGGVAVDPGAKAYWYVDENSYPRIEMSDLDSIAVDTLVTCPGERTGGVVIDSGAGTLYFATRTFAYPTVGKIRQVGIGGQNLQDFVVGLEEPYDIALDIANNHIYWTDFGTGKIQRADLATGDNLQDVVTGLNVPLGITLDREAAKLYWTNWGAGTLQRADLDGSNIEDVLTGLDQPAGVRVVVDEPTAAYGRGTVALDVRVLSRAIDQSTTFLVALSTDSRFVLDIYTVRGRRLTRVVDAYLTVGLHEIPWKGIGDNGIRAPSGVYFFRARSLPHGVTTGRAWLVR